MGGDYTRFTFDPSKDYLGVLKQQGRVSLDADWNELTEITDRRWRAETIDIMGRCIVPRSTPDAFRITPTGPGAFTIGIGRMYVDGLLAECHGLTPQRYQESLGELRGTTPVPYHDQPYYPSPVPLSFAGTPGTTDLIYLDVWQREVTAIEAPHIQEIALGGPDTATRLQTVWQVRVLENLGPHSCADPIDAWDAQIAPSAGRLTTSAVAPPASEDPCIISPAGGYRGLENRLYRVEIHTPGPLGVATFKWSRDNGSVVSAVEVLSASRDQLTVRRLGRDQVLRFEVDDWVEILDDHTEFAGAAGHMAKVTNIDEANRVLTIAPAVPGTFDPADPDRHTRVRRWDQNGEVRDASGNLIIDLSDPASSGVIPILATGLSVILEKGVQVTFHTDPAAGLFLVGDFWLFAARTANGSVEILNAAPPRGILHHYCKLGLITWANPAETSAVVDCRELWPPDAECCMEVVRPGEDIQAAIDRLPAEGGRVCLKVGVHRITQPIRIERSGVVLHGESLGAIVRSDTQVTLVRLADPGGATIFNVRVEDLRFETTMLEGAEALIDISQTTDAVVRHCELAVVAEGRAVAFAFGITISGDTSRVLIEDNELQSLLLGVYASAGEHVDLIRNRVRAPTVQVYLALEPVPLGLIGFFLNGVQRPCTILGNDLHGYWQGIIVRRGGAGSTIVRNHIDRFGTVAVAPDDILDGTVVTIPPGEPGRPTFFAVECAGRGCHIADNYMAITNARHGGIYVTGSLTRIEGNRIRSTVDGWDAPLPFGIVVDGSGQEGALEFCVVQNNTLEGVQNGITLLGRGAAYARGTQIGDNRFTGFFPLPEGDDVLLLLRYAILLRYTRYTKVTGNQLQRFPYGIILWDGVGNHVHRHRISDVVAAVIVSYQSDVDIFDNVMAPVRNEGVRVYRSSAVTIARNAISGASVLGIVLFEGTSNRVLDNRVTDGTTGISSVDQIGFVIAGNVVENMRGFGIAGLRPVHVTIRDNRVSWCGYDMSPNVEVAAGISLWNSGGDTTVESCEVFETGRSRAGETGAPLNTSGIALFNTERCHLRGNRVVNARELPASRIHECILLTFGMAAELLDNSTVGEGRFSLVRVRGQLLPSGYLRAFQDVVFSNNRCVHRTGTLQPRQASPGTVWITSRRRLTLVGNQIRADDRRVPSFTVTNASFITALGNVTSGDFLLPGLPTSTLPIPLSAFNHIQVP